MIFERSIKTFKLTLLKPTQVPKPKMVNVYEKTSASRPKQHVKKQPKVSGTSQWRCVHPKGVSYRERYLDNNSKTRYPKGPTPGEVVTAIEFRNGWIRVRHTGTETYWLPVEIKGVGVCFKQVKSGGMSSWSGGGGRDESSSEEESSSSRKRKWNHPSSSTSSTCSCKKGYKKRKKKLETSSPSSGSLFSALGFTTMSRRVTVQYGSVCTKTVLLGDESVVTIRPRSPPPEVLSVVI